MIRAVRRDGGGEIGRHRQDLQDANLDGLRRVTILQHEAGDAANGQPAQCEILRGRRPLAHTHTGNRLRGVAERLGLDFIRARAGHKTVLARGVGRLGQRVLAALRVMDTVAPAMGSPVPASVTMPLSVPACQTMSTAACTLMRPQP